MEPELRTLAGQVLLMADILDGELNAVRDAKTDEERAAAIERARGNAEVMKKAAIAAMEKADAAT